MPERVKKGYDFMTLNPDQLVERHKMETGTYRFTRLLHQENHPNPIVEARSPQESIVILPRHLCDMGQTVLHAEFNFRFSNPQSRCVVPILEGGRLQGHNLTRGGEQNYMQMSYYRDGQRLDRPINLLMPHTQAMIGPDGNTLPIVFAEGFIETQHTLQEAKRIIDERCDRKGIDRPPSYHAFAFATKPKSLADIQIPGIEVIAAFYMRIDIWGFGIWTDADKLGRPVRSLGGYVSPFAESDPQPPYAHALFKLNPRYIPKRFKQFIGIQPDFHMFTHQNQDSPSPSESALPNPQH